MFSIQVRNKSTKVKKYVLGPEQEPSFWGVPSPFPGPGGALCYATHSTVPCQVKHPVQDPPAFDSPTTRPSLFSPYLHTPRQHGKKTAFTPPSCFDSHPLKSRWLFPRPVPSFLCTKIEIRCIICIMNNEHISTHHVKRVLFSTQQTSWFTPPSSLDSVTQRPTTTGKHESAVPFAVRRSRRSIIN